MLEFILLILFLYVITGLFSKNPERRKFAEESARSGGFLRICANIAGVIVALIVLSVLGG